MNEKKRESKILQFHDNKTWISLLPEHRAFLSRKADSLRLTFQEIKILIDIASDLEMWEEGTLMDLWNEEGRASPPVAISEGKALKQKVLGGVKKSWNELKNKKKDYSNFQPDPPRNNQICFEVQSEEENILGICPVASEKTRCCNLQTLDAVKNCGFACTYCSIQSFYHDEKVYFHGNLKEKLENLHLDPEKIYHIGTGQSSDSLMWGNREGLLDHLFAFAKDNPNVILELKTKSKNISCLIENPVPGNVIAAWSLNPPVIIQNEEHLTASLKERIDAARQTADNGTLVGFHFHPIIWYQGWERDYGAIYQEILDRFDPEEVALVSFGTLTFIKPVIKALRQRKEKSKILQMPLENAEGKLSYPFERKLELFSHAYQSFSTWHGKVFFYLCMEDKKLWEPVFGGSYSSNDEFEEGMKRAYMEKIKRIIGKTNDDGVYMSTKQVRNDQHCFCCGKENEKGLKLVFEYPEEGKAVTSLIIPEYFTGWADITHGGLISMLLDEVMAHACIGLGLQGVTAEMTVRFLKPLTVNTEVKIEGTVKDSRSRIAVTEGVILGTDGTRYAEGKARFIKAGKFQ